MHLRRIGIAICLLCNLNTAFCAEVFEPVRSLPATQRVAKTQDIFIHQVRLADSVFSIGSIRGLLTIADELGDRSLKCFATSLLADQYARIRGLNDLSSQLHHDAVRLAESNKLPLMVGICTYRMGRYYYSFKDYPIAFEYLLRADNEFKEIGYKEVPDMDEILYFIGSIYYESGNYEKAGSYLRNIQQLKQVTPYVQKQALNTLALISRQQQDTVLALSYFKKILAAAIAQPDSAWIGISYSNIGGLYFAQHKFDSAYDLLQQGASISILKKQWSDAYTDLLLMARIDLQRNNPALALKRINSAIALHPRYFTTSGRKTLYETQAQYFEQTGALSQALDFQRKLQEVKDSLARSSNQQAYREIQLRIETEKHLSDIGKLEAETKAAAMKQYAIIAGLAMLLLVSLLLYRNYRMRSRNAAAGLQAEKLRAEEKLKYARQLLKNFTENSRQKNELIEQFAAELEMLKGSLPGHPVYEQRLRNFEKLVRSSILTDEEWRSFRELVDKVHKGFFTRLEDRFPGLDPSETKLASLIKLGVSEQEMAGMMGVDIADVRRSTQQLFQKIDAIAPGTTIEEKIQAI